MKSVVNKDTVQKEFPIDKEEWVDYPYIGIGEKPYSFKRKIPAEDQLEKIIG